MFDEKAEKQSERILPIPVLNALYVVDIKTVAFTTMVPLQDRLFQRR